MKTSLRSLLNIAVRLGAVLLAIHTVEQAPTVAYDVANGHPWPVGPLSFGALGLLGAGALWLWPGLLSYWAVGQRGNEVFETPLDAATLQHVAFAVTGVWLAVAGLTGVVGQLMSIAMMDDLVGTMRVTDHWIWVVRYAITGVAGVVLLVGARGLTSWLNDLRTCNLPPPVEEEPAE